MNNLKQANLSSQPVNEEWVLRIGSALGAGRIIEGIFADFSKQSRMQLMVYRLYPQAVSKFNSYENEICSKFMR